MIRKTQLITVTVLGLLLAAGPAAAADVPLIDAVKAGDAARVETLIDAGVDVNGSEPDGTTPLHWAAYGHDVEITRRLLEAGAVANVGNRYGVRPLSLAAVTGNAGAISALLTAGANPNTTLMEGETALMTAARSGNLEAVELLLDAGADVNVHEHWKGQTALMWAAAEGHAQVIPTLVSHGADLGARSERGFTALLFAAREGRTDVVQTLLEAGANLDEQISINSTLTAGGVEQRRASNAGLNAFLLAAGSAHFELAAYLLDRGADPNAAPRGWTALHQLSWVRKAGIAGSNNPAPQGSGNTTSLEFARKLIAQGADLNARVTTRPPAGITGLNFVDGTPFLLAARTADAELMRLLLEMGADAGLTNENNSTALMVAAGLGTSSPGEDPGTEAEVLEAVQVALGAGLNIDAVDDKGETAMHGAAYKHLPRVVTQLAEAGADIAVWNQKNDRGATPLDIAVGMHRGMNILSSPATEASIREVIAAAGVDP
ncbi:MAG: ankyrin repeat domain-containing protein [Vicinamibacterales bacterium]|nr:ankyrin repeat domain-containing protein [Vicinamibacterales bacterium]MDP7692734.1 ankyrin repeat domain-containing protein [Vicinamibacterales bacterium]